jgi:hypothetical protein
MNKKNCHMVHHIKKILDKIDSCLAKKLFIIKKNQSKNQIGIKKKSTYIKILRKGKIIQMSRSKIRKLRSWLTNKAKINMKIPQLIVNIKKYIIIVFYTTPIKA